jgi:hypothetical protein
VTARPDPDAGPPLRRWFGIGVLAVIGLVALLLLVRPLIYTVAEPRGDANLGVASVAELTSGPITRTVLLTQSHGLLGEAPQPNGVSLVLVIARLPGSQVAVVNARSSVDPCAVSIAAGGTELTDCGGRRWALDGSPLDGGDQPALQRFAATVEQGGVIVDLTRPVAGPGSPS